MEVPRSLLEQVLQLQQFQCPSCHDWQRLNLDPATMQQLWATHQRASPAPGALSQFHGGRSSGGSLNGHSQHSDSYYQQLDYSDSYDTGAGYSGGFARPLPAVRKASNAASGLLQVRTCTASTCMRALRLNASDLINIARAGLQDQDFVSLRHLRISRGFCWRAIGHSFVCVCALQLQATWQVKGQGGKASKADPYGSHSTEHQSERYRRKVQACP